MNKADSNSTPIDDDKVEGSIESGALKATPGKSKEVKWEVVAKESGLASAQIIANRLVVEGIPARAWQEGAGQTFGLTIGLLGTGYVVVPEEFVEEAKSILATPADDYLLDSNDYDEDE
jgi:hypothetical protein